MFNKLLSSLPFNPSLINQVSFYAARLKQESSVRRIGFVLIALVMVLQMFAVLSPAQPTLANDDNDVVAGGFSSKTDAVNACHNDRQGFRDVMAHFGVSCDRLSAYSRMVSLRSNAEGGQLYSMGRLSQGPVNQRTGKPTNETALRIGGTTFYLRLLSSFDSGAYSTYQALEVTNSVGVKYYILMSCGNVVLESRPVQPAPVPPPPAPVPPPPTPTKPCPEAKNSTDVASCITLGKKAENDTQLIFQANNTTANPGDQITYTLIAYNKGSLAYKDFVMEENLTDVLEYADVVNLDGGTINQSKVVSWAPADIAPRSVLQHTITVKVKDPIPSTPQPCNAEATSSCPNTMSFDLIMTNVYGNTVNIRVPSTIIKTTEIVTTKELPQTGPGTSLAIGGIFTVIVGYFFARSRLMAKELEIIKHEHVSGGTA